MFSYACRPFHVVILVAQGSFILDGSQKWPISKVSCKSQCGIGPNGLRPSYPVLGYFFVIYSLLPFVLLLLLLLLLVF